MRLLHSNLQKSLASGDSALRFPLPPMSGGSAPETLY